MLKMFKNKLYKLTVTKCKRLFAHKFSGAIFF